MTALQVAGLRKTRPTVAAIRAGHWAVSEDNLRANAVTIAKGTVLRMDLVGLLIVADEFMDQVCQAHERLTARCQP